MKNNKLLVTIVCAIVAILVVVAAVFGITKIAGGSKNPADSVTGFIDALKNVEIEKATSYTTDGNVDDLDLGEDSQEAVEMLQLYFKNLEYSVKNTTKEKDTAVVTVEISNKDLNAIFTMYQAKAIEIAMSKLGNTSTSTDEDMETELLNCFKSLFDSQEIESVTNTVDVKLNKVGKEWKVVFDETFVGAMLPGINEINNNFNTAE